MWQQAPPAAAGSSPSRPADNYLDHCTSRITPNFHSVGRSKANGKLQPVHQLGRSKVVCSAGDSHSGGDEQEELLQQCRSLTARNIEHGTPASSTSNIVGEEAVEEEGTTCSCFMPRVPIWSTSRSLHQHPEHKCRAVQCVKEETGQLDDMQTQSSLEDRSSVVESFNTINSINTHRSAGETALFRNYWSQPKKRKTPDYYSGTTDVSDAATPPQPHECPTRRKLLANLESDIIIFGQVIEAAIPYSPHTTTDSDLTSEMMADQESSKSSTEEEAGSHAAQELSTSAAPPESRSHHDFFLGPAMVVPELQNSGSLEESSQMRGGPSERQFYPPVAVLPSRVMSGDLQRYHADIEPTTQLELDMQIATHQAQQPGASGGSGASVSKQIRSLDEPAGTEDWLQLGLGGTSKTTPSSASRSVVPEFEIFKAPVSRSPSTPSRVPSSGPTQRLGQQPLDPAQLISIPFSLSPAQPQGQQSSSSFLRDPISLQARSHQLTGFGPSNAPSSPSWSEPQYYGGQYPAPPGGSSRAAPPIPGTTSFLSLAAANPAETFRQRDSQREHTQWSSHGRDPYLHPSSIPAPSMEFPFPERGPPQDHLQASRMVGRPQPGYSPGPSTQRVDFANLIQGFPRFPSNETGVPSQQRGQAQGASSHQEQRTGRLPWLPEVTSASEAIQLPPTRGGFASRAGAAVPGLQNIAAIQHQGSWERLLDRVGPNFPQQPLGGESEFNQESVNLAYKRKLDQFSGTVPSWMSKDQRGIRAGYEGGGAGQQARKAQRSEGSFLRLSPGSGRPETVEYDVARTAATSHLQSPAGLWFRLQPGDLTQTLEQGPRGFIRVMDESTPVSVVKKYIAKKLGLADDSQVSISCNDQEVQPSLSLQLVRDQLWQAGSTPPRISPTQATSSNAQDMDTLARQGYARENSDGSFSSPKDVVMVLTYRTTSSQQQQHQPPPPPPRSPSPPAPN